ncbi:hypothetical protein [Novosphingobium guangzhouense]|uniref:Sugar transporter n=1 Tax=Novosphingobium guangzhouense TaxID=1850347 RepID=A0A2K2FUM7_9SPHN|nr:hypothetical protein [Novosphingobium guangzhouense]PNU02482.1 hypothetical protein A8V01_08850 [Novosphingobium guangzhouense]
MAGGQGKAQGRAYWLIAVAAVLWNGFGCLDFTMTASRNPAYLAQMPVEVIDWLDSAPTWTLLPWALGVGGGLLGSLLLLVRSRWATSAFAGSILGLAVSQAWQFTVGLPPSMTTPEMLAMSVLIWAIALGLLWFAWDKQRAGVLR